VFRTCLGRPVVKTTGLEGGERSVPKGIYSLGT